MVNSELLVINFIFGLLSAFSPCLFPLLPSYVAITLKSNQSRPKIFLSSLFLILGVMIVFLGLGLVSGLIGSFLIDNYALFARIQGTLLILAGIILIRTPSFIYRITVPDRLNNWLYDDRNRDRPFLFSFVLGLLFTIIAAPCAAGYFIYVWGGLINQGFGDQILLVTFFALGVGVPFIIMSLSISQFKKDFVGQIHKATNRLGIIMGIILIAVGLLLLFEVTPFLAPFDL